MKLLYFDWRRNHGSFALVIFLHHVGGVARDSDEIIRALGGFMVGLAQGLHAELEPKPRKWVQEAKARILDIVVIHLPVVLSRDMTITDMSGTSPPFGIFGFDTLGLGTCDGNYEVIIGQIEMIKINLAERGEEAAEFAREDLQPSSLNLGIRKPIDALRIVFRGVDWRIGKHLMNCQ